MAYHIQPLKKRGEMPLPTLSPIPFKMSGLDETEEETHCDIDNLDHPILLLPIPTVNSL